MKEETHTCTDSTSVDEEAVLETVILEDSAHIPTHKSRNHIHLKWISGILTDDADCGACYGNAAFCTTLSRTGVCRGDLTMTGHSRDDALLFDGKGSPMRLGRGP